MQLAVRSDPVDTLEAQLLAALDAEHRHAAIDGITEIDRPVRAQHDIIGAIELLVLPMGRDDLAVARARLHDQLAGGVLADVEIARSIIRHAIAFIGRPAHLDDAALLAPAPPHIAWHVAEIEALVLRAPDRPLRELEACTRSFDDRF